MSDSVDGILEETTARLFAKHVSPALLASSAQGIWPAPLWSTIEEIGLTKALLPEDAGGFGLPVSQALRLLRLAGEAALPLPLAETMLAGWLLAGAGLPIEDGPLTIAMGDSLTLEPNGASWRLRGQATFVPWGRDARMVTVLVMRKGQAFVAAVPGAAAQCEPSANIAGEPRDRLSFDMALPVDSVAPAASGIGLLQLRAAGAAARSMMIAGTLQRVSDMTVQYAQERKQFGKPIGRLQAVQQNLAVLAGEAAAAAAASDLAADGFADGLRIFAIAAGKARSSEAAGIGAAIAHQVHGAIGFTQEHSLHFLTKRLWSWRDEFGTEAEWSRCLGMQAAADGADRLWAGITAL